MRLEGHRFNSIIAVPRSHEVRQNSGKQGVVLHLLVHRRKQSIRYDLMRGRKLRMILSRPKKVSSPSLRYRELKLLNQEDSMTGLGLEQELI